MLMLARMTRFEILRTPLLIPLLLPFGGSKARSVIELGERQLHCKFGFLFDESFRYDEITGAERDRWPWYGGLGWRTDLRGKIALVGSLDNVVRIDLKPDTKARLFAKLPCKQLYISLEEPDAFLEALKEKRRAADKSH